MWSFPSYIDILLVTSNWTRRKELSVDIRKSNLITFGSFLEFRQAIETAAKTRWQNGYKTR